MNISVVIATRNRTELLPRSLCSVAAQTHGSIELIVVDDSSTEEIRAANAALVRQICPHATHAPMPPERTGRGPAFARNHGIERCTGEYVAFLDDDDEWIDPAYLEFVAALVAREGFDAHFADQEAMRPDGSIYPPPVWTEDLATKLRGAGLAPKSGSYRVPADMMLLSDGFAHLNATVVRRALLQDSLGGFDLRITYEEDREIYFRIIDAAASIGYTPRLVARHHIPAGSRRPSASNTVPDQEKDASRLRYFENLIATARQEPVRERSRRERVIALKRIATRAARAGNFAEARRYGTEALRSAFGLKWMGYMAWLLLRGALAPARSPGSNP